MTKREKLICTCMSGANPEILQWGGETWGKNFENIACLFDL